MQGYEGEPLSPGISGNFESDFDKYFLQAAIQCEDIAREYGEERWQAHRKFLLTPFVSSGMMTWQEAIGELDRADRKLEFFRDEIEQIERGNDGTQRAQ